MGLQFALLSRVVSWYDFLYLDYPLWQLSAQTLRRT